MDCLCLWRSIATAAAPNTPENEKSSRARRPTAEPSMADGASTASAMAPNGHG